MNLAINYNKAYKKSARIVGDVMGKYHPHGDQAAIYDSMVRMAPRFFYAIRVRLMVRVILALWMVIRAAAMRYTEARLAKISEKIVADLDKETVSFQPNYDDSQQKSLQFACSISKSY